MSERIFATQGEVLEFLRGLGLKNQSDENQL